ncbi:MAG TPA: DUF2892 domain-containing protein [Burkholderiales bacterium]
MKTNVGTLDKVVRVILGIGLLSLIFLLEGNAKWWGLVGLIPLITGLVGTCPLYMILGLSTCSAETRHT